MATYDFLMLVQLLLASYSLTARLDPHRPLTRKPFMHVAFFWFNSLLTQSVVLFACALGQRLLPIRTFLLSFLCFMQFNFAHFYFFPLSLSFVRPASPAYSPNVDKD
jgi:ABC-type antimicrobial peptide transport system permease subunit